jgi:hypothetical protein
VQIGALKSLLEAAGLVEILPRAIQLAFGAARYAPVVESVGIIRLEPDGLVEIVQRTVQVAFIAARNAPVVEGKGIVRLEPDGSMASRKYAGGMLSPL